jgi:hypothetical protein
MPVLTMSRAATVGRAAPPARVGWARLTLTSVTTAMNGYEYQAVFTDSAGSATTSPATLTVNAAGSAPTITGTPNSQTVTAGQGDLCSLGQRQSHADSAMAAVSCI